MLLPFSITGVSDVKLNTVMNGWTVRATGSSTAIACFVAMDTVLHKLLVKRQDSVDESREADFIPLHLH